MSQRPRTSSTARLSLWSADPLPATDVDREEAARSALPALTWGRSGLFSPAPPLPTREVRASDPGPPLQRGVVGAAPPRGIPARGPRGRARRANRARGPAGARGRRPLRSSRGSRGASRVGPDGSEGLPLGVRPAGAPGGSRGWARLGRPIGADRPAPGSAGGEGRGARAALRTVGAGPR